MAEEKDEAQFGEQNETGQDKQQQPAGQQGQPRPTGEQGQPQPTGQQGQSASGQTDLGQSGDTATLSGEPNPGQSASPGSGGFVGSHAGGSSEYLQEEATTAESEFASQGQGALEDEDIETGQPQSRESDIEGSSGNV